MKQKTDKAMIKRGCCNFLCSVRLKKLLVILIFFLIFTPGFSELQTDRKVEYETYSDPGALFEVKYPKGLLISKPNGTFISSDSNSDRVYMEAHSESSYENRTWEWDCDYRLSVEPPGENKEVTYKVLKKDFFVYSGSLEGRIFYTKAIPVEKNGKRYILVFNMQFPEKDKEKWDPILTICANSFSLTSGSYKSGASKGWTESAEEKKENDLVRKAKKWVASNLQCEQSEDFNNDSSGGKESLGKCKVDEKSIPFFNLKTSSAKQFLISVHGPLREGPPPFRGDYKYVLFTFENQKLTGEVLHRIEEGEMPGFHDPVEVVDLPNNKKLLALEIAGDRGCDSIVLVFKMIDGKIKEVLNYQDWADETKPGQGNGMETLLLPQTNGDLRILRHKWVLDESRAVESEDSEATLDSYSEIFYHFDSDQKKYLPLAKEKEMPSKSASVEWKNLTE